MRACICGDEQRRGRTGSHAVVPEDRSCLAPHHKACLPGAAGSHAAAASACNMNLLRAANRARREERQDNTGQAERN